MKQTINDDGIKGYEFFISYFPSHETTIITRQVPLAKLLFSLAPTTIILDDYILDSDHPGDTFLSTDKSCMLLLTATEDDLPEDMHPIGTTKHIYYAEDIEYLDVLKS